MTLKASPKSLARTKSLFRFCSRLAVESDKLLLVFRIRYPDVPSVPSWAGGTSAVWLLFVSAFSLFSNHDFGVI